MLLLIVVLTGHFNDYMAFMILIVIHELGHIMSSLLFRWKIDSIIILPLGCITKYNELINRPLYQEFIVASMGIIIQLIIYLLFFRNNKIFFYGNLFIIAFNMLPIIPLDGSKLLNVLFNKLFSFKLSYILSYCLSYIILIILIVVSIIYKDIVLMITFLPLLYNLVKEYNNINNIINKFYLERYLYDLKFDNYRLVKGKNINKMKKDYYHIFINNNKIYTEQEILKDMYINKC